MLKVRTTAVGILTLLLVFNAGTAFAATRTVTLRVGGMTCEGCAVTIEKALKDTNGVLDARVSYEKGEAWVKYDDRKVSVRKLRQVINGTGFKVVSGAVGVESLAASAASAR
ncbi:MAG: heavy-metal-associated domain-containing protein [Pyrinomonadaceae bacterium]